MSQLGRSAGLTGYLELARQVGVDAYQLATVVGLPGAALTDPDLRVSAEAMARMYELAAEQSGLEDFALRVAANRRISNIGMLGLVVREQPNVRKALQAYARYGWLQNEAFAIELREFGDQAVIHLHRPVWMMRQTCELVAASTVRNLKAILGESWRPLEVWLPHGPVKTELYRRVLGVTPRFEQDIAAIILRRSDLDMPIPTADPAMARQIAQLVERMTEERRVDLPAKVGDLIVALLPDGVCTVDRVAQHLGMDRRTLHRRLSAEGTTFSDILDARRRDMAASLLASSDRPLQNVADLLGFSSLSAFAHWFRRKFSQSASAYRAAHAGGPMRPSGALMPAE